MYIGKPMVQLTILLYCVAVQLLEFHTPPMIIYSKSFPGGPNRFEGPDDALQRVTLGGLTRNCSFLGSIKYF